MGAADCFTLIQPALYSRTGLPDEVGLGILPEGIPDLLLFLFFLGFFNDLHGPGLCFLAGTLIVLPSGELVVEIGEGGR
jgi:hypothetical protein